MRKLKLRLFTELGKVERRWWSSFHRFEASQNIYQELRGIGSRVCIRKSVGIGI